jgi:transketolase
MSVAIGAALSKRLNKDSKLIYSLHGDGELQEGQIWEAALFASANKVDNYIATIDVNRQQIDGPTDEVMAMGSIRQKFEAFGWEVMDIQEGNDMQAVITGIQKAKTLTGKGKPVCVLLHTEMGYGVDFMQGTHHWHGKAPNDDQLANALGQLEESIGDY